MNLKDGIESIIPKNPKYSDELLEKYLTEYGDYVTDDAYEDFLKSKGRELPIRDLEKGYRDTYLKDKEFYKHVYDTLKKYDQLDLLEL